MKYLKNNNTLTYNEEKCSGCQKCLEVCPHNVFEFQSEKIKIVDKDACMECGACMLNCPTKALNVCAGVGCALAIIHGWVN